MAAVLESSFTNLSLLSSAPTARDTRADSRDIADRMNMNCNAGASAGGGRDLVGDSTTPTFNTASPAIHSTTTTTPHVRRPGIAPLIPTIEKQEQQGNGSDMQDIQHSSMLISSRPSTSASVSSSSSSTRSPSSSSATSLSSSPLSSSSLQKPASSSSCSSLSRTSSCSSRTSSTSSIVRAIDFAYCLPSPGLFDGLQSGTATTSTTSLSVNDPRRGRSSPTVSTTASTGRSMNTGKFRRTTDVTSSTGGRPSTSNGVFLSRSSSIASSSSSYSYSRSSLSSRRSSVYASSPSSSLASQFREWAFTEGPLATTSNNTMNYDNNNGKNHHHHYDYHNNTQQRRKMSLHPITTSLSGHPHRQQLQNHDHHHQDQLPLSSSPTSSSDIFSPLTNVPPLPASAYPPGLQMGQEKTEGVDDGDNAEHQFKDSAIIDDNEGLICFQPGCETTINEGTYYCHKHDDPFGDDP